MNERLSRNETHPQQLFHVQNIGYIKLSREDFNAVMDRAQFVCTECGQAATREMSQELQGGLQSAPKLWVL